jgi:hypothetical protein
MDETKKATYEFEDAIRRALDALDFAEQEGSGFPAVRHWIQMAKEAYEADTKIETEAVSVMA